MHASASEFGRIFFQLYWKEGFRRILDIGSLDINGSLRQHCPPGAEYIGIDLSEGPGVDLVLHDPYRYPFQVDHFDLIVSTSCFEHDPMFWLTFLEASRVLSQNGFLYINAPSNGWYHTHPWDNWRFYPDSALALESWGRRSGIFMHVIESFIAGRTSGDVWNDCVMIFSKTQTYAGPFVSDAIKVAYNIRKAGNAELHNSSPYPEDMTIIRDQDAKIRELTSLLAKRTEPIRPPSVDVGIQSGQLFPRLLTMHNTVLYVDGRGMLRHGPRAESPSNVRLQLDGSRGQLMREVGSSRQTMIYNDGHFVAGLDDRSATPVVFELVSLKDGRVGLKANDRFLSAIGRSGDVLLNARLCAGWENFVLWDPPPLRRGTDCGAFSRKTPSMSISCIFAYNEARDPGPAVRAVECTARCIRIDCLYWFSDSEFPKHLPGVEVINIVVPALVNFHDDINALYLRVMPRVVTTDFNLVVHPDGFAVNPQAWDDRFWEYDYIGAVWQRKWGGGPYLGGPIVGNGGFSLRSRKLYDALIDLCPTWRFEDWAGDPRLDMKDYYVMKNNSKFIPEDILLCIWYRSQLEEKYGIVFCPPELANKFSVEGIDPYNQYWVGRSFGFHDKGAAPYYGAEI
jgi:hypothetical protein